MTILHVDMDAFYASVEQRDRPELRGLPVIVGGTATRGVVCAASYEARKFGIRSAMPSATARRLCPHGVFLPVRMGHYVQASHQIREILLSFTPVVEPLSLDEAFLDVRGCEGLFGSPQVIAKLIKERIQAETNLIASVGVAPNKFLAKIASDLSKPNGLLIIPGDQVRTFLDPLAVGRLWGVGAKCEARLRALGWTTVGQLAALSEKTLRDHLGDLGGHLWRLAQGEDDRQVLPEREARSISTETTFEHDINDRAVLRTWLLELVDQLAGRLRHHGYRAKSIDVKIRSADFRTRTRSVSLSEPTHVTDLLWRVIGDCFERSLTRDMLPVRLLGVGASKLTRQGETQGSLFDEVDNERREALDQAVDAIRGQFGATAIRRGNLLHGVTRVGVPRPSTEDRGE